ncbi:MAG: helix-hairpin-helix domain-containing protein [Cucumibacter sp.]
MAARPDDLPKLARPAQRALAQAGISRLGQLAKLDEAAVARLHGMGPKTMQALKLALAANGQSFRR